MTAFADLSLDPRVLQAVTESGYLSPTPIQAQAIPHALEGRDVLGIAQTGTGKTASFTLPMITHLSKGRARARMPRSLVLCPTRELAAQVAENFEKYSKHVKLTMALLIGGVSFKDQDKLIDRGVDVLIATPGRLLDHFERGKLMLTGVQIMVVDEADRMLDMGFIPDIERIFKLVPFTRQTLFFSATMAPEITRITQEFLHNPVRVEVARQATTSETISQFLCRHTPSRKDRADSEKRDLLRRLIRAEGDALTNGIVFCNRKRDVDVVAKSLQRHGFDAAALHGDLDQKLRMQILGKFRDGELKLLIASDVAARGLDIPSVSHVFNFDVPIHSEDYVHRIGRTGRAGRTGRSITLCLPSDEKYLAKIEELVGKAIPVMESPMPAAAAGSAVEDTASAAPDERRGRRREGGRGEGGRGDRSRGREARPEPQAAAVPQSAAEEAAPAPAPRSRGGERRQGDRVVGLGDHVPAFLLREFRFDDLVSDPEPQGDVVEPEAPETVADTVEPVVTEAPVAEAPVADQSEAAPEAPAPAEAPESLLTPEASTEAAAPEADAPKADAPEAEAAAAPEAAPEAVAEEPAAPAKRPRRPRKRATPATDVPESSAA